MIKLCALSRRYGHTIALQPVDLEVARNETISIVGSSGAGKTTLLRCVAGLDRSYSGTISLGGLPARTYLAEKRPAMVFQRYANFHWLTVLENLEQALIHMNDGEKQRRQKCEAMLKIVGLEEQGARYIAELSGGMQQRVAVARALLQDDDIILLDEPFGSLDIANRATLQDFVKSYFREQKKTTIFVTHDPVEAIYVGDRILLLSDSTDHAHRMFDSPVRNIVAQSAKGQKRFLDLQLELTQLLMDRS